jgi:hypothetical protein
LFSSEHFEEIALDTEDHKPAKWLRNVNCTFVVWPHGPTRLQEFLYHLNSVRPTMKFIIEVEVNDTLPFSDVFAVKRGPKLTAKIYWKPTHTGHYLHFDSNHLHHVKRGVVYILIGIAKIRIRWISTRKLKV